MASWYYVDQGNNRKGPVPAESLAEAYRQGQVGQGNLVWREGMAEWAPLEAHLDELGLDRVRPTAPPTANPAAPPAKSNKGCLIAIVVGVVGLFLIAILAILAAIALPAYQDYIARSKVSAALLDAQPAKVMVAEFVAGADRCPRDAEELGLDPPSGVRLDSIRVGSLETGSCAIELVMAAGSTPSMLSEAVILLELDDDGRWYCSSDELPDKYLPNSCR